MFRVAIVVISVGILLPGCLAEGHVCDDAEESVGSRGAALAHPGRFIPSLEGPYVRYDDAPAWDGGAHCSGTFTDGARELRSHLMAEFPQISTIEGYNCRQNTANTSKTSMHGTGRAIDVFIPLSGGDADNDLGDPVANWLIENADAIGVQYIVWDRTSWAGHRSSPKHRSYTGPHPHHDHLHVELNLDGASRSTPWFSAPSSLDAALVSQGSDAETDPTGTAQLRACTGSTIVFTFELENVGEAPWVDASDYTAGAWGRAVRLGVPRDYVDPFVSVSRISLNRASNLDVRSVGPDCNDASGCNRTVFTIMGTVPDSIGVHRTVWQLVDENRAWFGPMMWQSVDAIGCEDPVAPIDPEPVDPADMLVDADLDGAPSDIDCDDDDPDVYPYNLDICEDGVDQDCDGVDRLCEPGEGASGPEVVDDDVAGGDRALYGHCSASPGRGAPLSIAWLVLLGLGVTARRR